MNFTYQIKQLSVPFRAVGNILNSYTKFFINKVHVFLHRLRQFSRRFRCTGGNVPAHKFFVYWLNIDPRHLKRDL
jgi:hypothetical protein